MKNLLIILALLPLACFAQTQPPKEVQVQLKGDTLVIPYYPLYKFIQIGERVYKIEAPTLIEAKPGPKWGTFDSGTILFNGYTTPAVISSSGTKSGENKKK